MPAADSPAIDLDEAIALLRETPTALSTLLDGLPAAWTERRPAPESWSPHETVCHMTYIEQADWLPRVRIILEHGEARPFDPVDHGLQSERFAGRSTRDVVATFARQRAANLDELAGFELTATDLDRRGTHPTLGRVTLGQLVATWAVHDLNHTSQVLSGLAYRYETAVGPWKRMLGILEREP